MRPTFYFFPIAALQLACTEDVFSTADAADPTADSSPEPDSPFGDRKDAAIGKDGEGGNEASLDGGSDTAAIDGNVGKDAAVCTPFGTDAGFTCIFNEHVSIPKYFCSTGGGVRFTPVDCQCVETYTCACMIAHQVCAAQGCTETNGDVWCQ